mmetsp:Transcript_108719/g.318073  ORF Transcript_108719/g.318073 Transcript_108719/m.318073 type:complete len:209 (-) Transcript_108719:55-681(-)
MASAPPVWHPFFMAVSMIAHATSSPETRACRSSSACQLVLIMLMTGVRSKPDRTSAMHVGGWMRQQKALKVSISPGDLRASRRSCFSSTSKASSSARSMVANCTTCSAKLKLSPLSSLPGKCSRSRSNVSAAAVQPSGRRKSTLSRVSLHRLDSLVVKYGIFSRTAPLTYSFTCSPLDSCKVKQSVGDANGLCAAAAAMSTTCSQQLN